MPAGSPKTSQRPRRSAAGSGLLTGLSTLAVSGAAAVAGALVAQKFGRSAETDGFLAAYGVYLALVIGAQAFRMVVVPDLTRAAAKGLLAAETTAYGAALLAVALPASAAVLLFSGPLGEAITGGLPVESAQLAADALRWLVPAAFAQLLAALAAATLASRDSYGLAAVGYAVGAVAGVALFLVLADDHGLLSLAWGIALNGALTLAIPLAGVLVRVKLVRGDLRVRARLGRLAQGAAVALALQAMYLVGLRLAADLGVGEVTSFSYAYLLAATLVAVTASSLSLVSAAGLTRRGLSGDAAATHVVSSTWLSLAPIGAAAGVFALVGERIVAAVLGDAYAGDVGAELGHLVAYLAPWMLVATAFSVTLPLLFVVERSGRLIGLAAGALALHLLLAWAGREIAGLPGIAVALALSTLLVVADMLDTISRRTALVALPGIFRAGAIVAAAAGAAFGVAGIALDGAAAAGLGIGVYALFLGAARRFGLRQAWCYVRALH